MDWYRLASLKCIKNNPSVCSRAGHNYFMTRTALASAFLVLGFVGCASPEAFDMPAAPTVEPFPNPAMMVDAPQGAANAIAAIWKFYGGQTPTETISFYGAAAMNCGDGRGWLASGVCIDGAGDGIGHLVVGLPPGWEWWSSSLAHEMCHVWAGLNLGDYDAGHQGVCFTNNGMVAHANGIVLGMAK